MDINILISTRHFLLDGSDAEHPVITYDFPYINISNDQDGKRKIFHNDEYIEQVGRIEALGSFSRYAFAYARIELPKEKENSTKLELLDILNHQTHMRLKYFEGVLSYLWFAKDNSVCSYSAVAQIPEKEKHMVRINSESVVSTCAGEYTDTSFSINDMELALTIMEKCGPLCPNFNLSKRIVKKLPEEAGKIPVHSYTSELNITYNQYNRIERAFLFLGTARTKSVLEYKIALYVPVFESLFSAESGGELSHKISERAAFYISQDPKRRREIFNDLKDAYTIRSKFLHGDLLPNKLANKDEQLRLSKSIDDITRQVLMKIITQDAEMFLKIKNEKKVFEEYLSNLIFQ